MFNAARSSRVLRALALVAAAIAALLVGGPAALAQPLGASLPDDPNANGYVGLCDQAGHNVTGGRVSAVPFVWKAVASQPPPAAYQGRGQNAVLNIYQPRPQAAPAYWSGQSVTAASFYRQSRTPAVQATYGDESLADYIAQFPPKVNGTYVLRIYYGKQNYGLYSSAYPSTTIQVTGRTWHVIRGGTVACSAATATSNEQLTGVAGKRQTTPRAPSAGEQTTDAKPGQLLAAAPLRTARAVGGGAGGPDSASGPAASAAGSPGHAGAETPVAHASRTSSVAWVLWALLAAVAVLGGALLYLLRTGRSRPAA